MTVATALVQEAATGSISGRVTMGSKPATGVVILLSTYPQTHGKITARATTGPDGRFHLQRIPAGRYLLVPWAYDYAWKVGESFNAGLRLTLGEGETVDGLEITLEPGGVITGRVLERGGAPAIQVRIQLLQIDANGRTLPLVVRSYWTFWTDDRGIYRIFGLPAGRYLVSAGQDQPENRSTFFPRTYYPNALDEARATIVELAPGMEASGIDIVLAPRTKTFSASGRVVSVGTGEPVADAIITCGPDAKQAIWAQTTRRYSDSQGRFTLTGLMPGRYWITARAASPDVSLSSSKPVELAVEAADVEGLTIEMARGATISGTVEIEDIKIPATDEGLRARFSICAMAASLGSDGPCSAVAVDGTFRITSVEPGRTRLSVESGDSSRRYRVVRVERDGLPLTGGLEVIASEEITGVHVVLSQATSSISGRVDVKGGALPAHVRLVASASRDGDDDETNQAFADVRGRFQIDHLVPGEYTVRVRAISSHTVTNPALRRGAEQRVVVREGGTAEVTLAIELDQP